MSNDDSIKKLANIIKNKYGNQNNITINSNNTNSINNNDTKININYYFSIHKHERKSIRTS